MQPYGKTLAETAKGTVQILLNADFKELLSLLMVFFTVFFQQLMFVYSQAHFLMGFSKGEVKRL